MKLHEQSEVQLTLQEKSLILMLTKRPKSLHSKSI